MAYWCVVWCNTACPSQTGWWSRGSRVAPWGPPRHFAGRSQFLENLQYSPFKPLILVDGWSGRLSLFIDNDVWLVWRNGASVFVSWGLVFFCLLACPRLWPGWGYMTKYWSSPLADWRSGYFDLRDCFYPLSCIWQNITIDGYQIWIWDLFFLSSVTIVFFQFEFTPGGLTL